MEGAAMITTVEALYAAYARGYMSIGKVFLPGADLGGADLSGADLRGANLDDANLFEADLDEAKMPAER
jgi:uncharacterized protein YjbI with pentapeptide repeats